jgi:hypothetical protein
MRPILQIRKLRITGVSKWSSVTQLVSDRAGITNLGLSF